MSWCFADERDGRGLVFLEALSEREGLVPALWPLEVANALVVAERSKRITLAESNRFPELMQDLSLLIDQGLPLDRISELMALTRSYGLSVYDASYLELSIRTGMPFATMDRKLSTAAKRAGVVLA